MDSQGTAQAPAAHLGQQFLRAVAHAVEQYLHRLEAGGQLPGIDKLWNTRTETPTRRLLKAEESTWSFYEPVLRGILDEQVHHIDSKDEDTARAAQWAARKRIAEIEKLTARAAYKLELAELNEQIQLEHDAADGALSGGWTLWAMREAFDHEYERDKLIEQKYCLRKLFRQGAAASSQAIQQMKQHAARDAEKLSPLGLFGKVCSYGLRDSDLAERLLAHFEHIPPASLQDGLRVLASLSKDLQVPMGDWQDPIPASHRARHTGPARILSSASRSHLAPPGYPTHRTGAIERRASSGDPPHWGTWSWAPAERAGTLRSPSVSPTRH
ncbi:hypothetical protein JCM10908_005667 [Rhodotorula pacifica]|uniref:uncharacterized protein n=1 Tax=Rhodotorula pacifica TaxID=1495444 RepID=UPI003181EF68